ncbi:MAG: hypothetical protein JWO20_2167 [Candidatus Angelobacter sp.]|jgi:hypothetical protein|nr:hypothetical protein [Candidatus Angelobacter sp.]
MPETEARKFATYEEFFAFYVKQHSNPTNRLLHAFGTGLGFSIMVGAFALGHRWWALLWIPIAYGFAWTGHFLIEGNKPATFGHPLWSFISDFRMLGLMLTGKLQPWLDRQ